MPYTTVPTTAIGAPATGTASLSPDAGAALPSSDPLTDTCTNTRHEYADDGAGGQTQTDLALGPWACRMLKEPKPLDKTLAGGVTVTVASRELEVELGADVRIGDALQHGGREYAVLDSDAGTTGATFVTVYLEWLGHLSAS